MTQKLQALLIFPYAGIYPTPVDPENPTQEEQDAIDAWEAIIENNIGLKAKIDHVEDWLLDGDFEEIIEPEQGVRVTKAGQFGTAVSFPMVRILKLDPTTWFTNKIQQLRDNGWSLRGYATDDWAIELSNRNYEIVTE